MTNEFSSLEWRISDIPVSYPEALTFMEERVEAISAGKAPECIWLLEHPPLYTAGTSARAEDLLWPDRFPVYASGRGGQYTYHGPGQRVAYVMVDLRRFNRDVRRFVHLLEAWLIETLAQFVVQGERREDRIGIWVQQGNEEKKIAALGLRVRRWVSFHGIALNVDPDLSHFEGIVPCGISSYGVTSLWDQGVTPTIPEVDSALRLAWEKAINI